MSASLRRGVGGLCLAVVATLSWTVVPAQAQGDDDSMSTKTVYVAPSTTYSPAPDGFRPVNTQVVARHGSRGLSGFKYDAMTMAIWQKAKAMDAVKPFGEDLFDQTERIHEANEKLGDEATWARMTAAGVVLNDGTFEKGYGNLTGVGAQQHRDLGRRLARRMPSLFTGATATNIRVVSSGEPRAAESGFDFVDGLVSAAPALDGKMSRAIPASVSTLRFYDDKSNSDYADYTAYLDGDKVSSYVDAVNARPESVRHARQVLEKVYTTAFVDGLADGSITVTDATGKKLKGVVDAALKLYNLYIIAPSMAQEVKVDFGKYFTREQADWFAMCLDAEDFAQKGPGFVGSDISYRNSKVLLDDFFTSIDEQTKASPRGSATLRFGHAETLIPFEALIKAPGSRAQVDPTRTDFWQATDWRGARQGKMAVNVQWDVFQSARGQRVVRMLLNEIEATFGGDCRPVREGSVYYTEDELKRCLTGATVAPDAWRIAGQPGKDRPQRPGHPGPGRDERPGLPRTGA
ncbi:histidine-type phosphatase [Acidipropionibacterium timonense]|uniref:histidine-type phosphatase n=1 Tax=Acidipropionibacterium timonense TaxID=2161818 RepID=UPI001FD9C82E|nr:histidine-type phosphatase [Acidipropionibacterium timonense]